MITHVKEGCKEETLYGRSVRKTVDHRYGWLEVHFTSGEVIKVEGEGANILRQILEDEVGGKEPAAAATTPQPARKSVPNNNPVAEPTAGRHDQPHPHSHSHSHPPRAGEDHRGSPRNGFGR
jgi:hypothetical protein